MDYYLKNLLPFEVINKIKTYFPKVTIINPKVNLYKEKLNYELKLYNKLHYIQIIINRYRRTTFFKELKPSHIVRYASLDKEMTINMYPIYPTESRKIDMIYFDTTRMGVWESINSYELCEYEYIVYYSEDF